MSNIIINKLTVKKGVKKIFSSLGSEVANHTIVSDELYDILKNFSLQKIIKCDPDDRQEAFDKWGCPSDAQTDLDEFLSEDGAVNLINSFGEFNTESHPPVEIVRELQKMFPDYAFALDYVDEGLGFCGTVDVKGENTSSKKEKDLRYYGAYLLRESKEDLDEFFEDCEYDDDGNVKDEFDKFVEKNS